MFIQTKLYLNTIYIAGLLAGIFSSTYKHFSQDTPTTSILNSQNLCNFRFVAAVSGNAKQNSKRAVTLMTFVVAK